MTGNKKILISFIIGLIISAVALYFAFKNIDFNSFIKYLASINYFWIIPALAVFLFGFVLRVVRWQIILDSAQAKVSFWHAFHPLMISFMVNNVLPGRVGELARPAIIQKSDNVKYSTGLGTVVTERIFDLLTLLILFAFVLSFVHIDPTHEIVFGNYHLNKETLESIASGMLKLCILCVICVILISITKVQKLMHYIIANIPNVFITAKPAFKNKVANYFSKPLAKILDNFIFGFSLVKKPKKVFYCIILSFIIWWSCAYSYYLVSLGCPDINVTQAQMTAVMIIICFFIALPSVPGFWGVFEAGGIFALFLFGVSAKSALGFTLVNHVIQLFPIIIIGFVSMIITGVNFKTCLKKDSMKGN